MTGTAEIKVRREDKNVKEIEKRIKDAGFSAVKKKRSNAPK